MGKKSKRPNRGNKKTKSATPRSRILTPDNIANLNQEELLAVAEKEHGSPIALACYAYLMQNILATEKNGSDDRLLKSYVDKVREIESNHLTLPHHAAFNLFFALLRLGDSKQAFQLYMSRFRGTFNMGQLLYASGLMGKDIGISWMPKYIIQILEDHKDVAVKSTRMEDLHSYYAYLSASYKKENRFKEERESLQMQLATAKKLNNDHHRQVFAMKEMAENFSKTGKYDEAMDILQECMLLQTTHGGDLNSLHEVNEYISMKAEVFFKMATVIKTRSVAEHGVILHSDAKRVLDMNKKATEAAMSILSNPALPYPKKFLMVSLYTRNLGYAYGDVGDHKKGIEECLRSGEIMKDSPNHGIDEREKMTRCKSVAIFCKHAFQGAGEICLQKFYRLKSRGEPFDDTKILHQAKDYAQQSLTEYKKYRNWNTDTSEALIASELCLVLAQVYYFLHDTSEAYKYLSFFLDDHFVHGGLSCGACKYKSSKHAVRKTCGGCNATYYCSSICQSLHWKTNIAGMIRHKDLCPLIGAWRKKPDDFILNEQYEEMFKGFFEGLLKKEHGPVEVGCPDGYFDTID